MQTRKSRFTIKNWAVAAIALVFAVGAFTGSAQAKLKPTVSFTGAPAVAANGTSFTVTATTNDGATATITVTGACSISGTAVTMTENKGTCTMKASWPATPTYLAATATQKTKATTGYTESDLYYFGTNLDANGDDGKNPAGNGMVMDKDGNIYASTQYDINGEAGAIVELSPAGQGV
jgi:hypothetical protein